MKLKGDDLVVNVSDSPKDEVFISTNNQTKYPWIG